MSINDVSGELLSKIREQFENDVTVQRMRIRQRVLQDKGDYKGALVVGRQIEDLYTRVVQSYMADAEAEAKSIPLESLPASKEDKDAMLSLCVTLFMTTEIINSAIMDIDTILHRYDKDLHFEMFNDVKELVSNVRDKISYLQKNTKYADDHLWGVKCDDMYDMIRNKARSIIRKHGESPDWGKNLQRYDAKLS